MKTNRFWNLFTILSLVLCTTFVLFSCGKDDDSNENDFSLIGTWKYTFEGPSDYVLLTFNVDGTGKSVEFDNGKIDGDESFKYSYAESILTVYYEDGDKETVMINWKDNNKFITSWYDQVDTWIRQ